MSYGNWGVYEDLKKGVSTKEIASGLIDRYEISLERAKQIVKAIKHYGVDVGIDWNRKRVRKGRPQRNDYGILMY